jgi:hypothetical protein
VVDEEVNGQESGLQSSERDATGVFVELLHAHLEEANAE